MEMNARNQDGVVVVSITGRLDATTAPAFDAWFSERLAAAEFRLLLDLSSLEYVSSAGLRSLLAAAKQIKAHQGLLLLCGLVGSVEEVFRISGFVTIFQIYPAVDEALKAIS